MGGRSGRAGRAQLPDADGIAERVTQAEVDAVRPLRRDVGDLDAAGEQLLVRLLRVVLENPTSRQMSVTGRWDSRSSDIARSTRRRCK